MKKAIRFLTIAISLAPLHGYAQLNPGGIFANFGVDADTRTNWVKYGPVKGAISSDDWFAPSGVGNNVIDTSNWATYLAQLSAGGNISFNKRMSALLYAKVGGKLWLDAVYGRDFTAASTAKDSTTFTVASKNGDNPVNWKGGVSNFPNKNDLVDVYAHMRRDGTSVHDSLWFFTAVSTYGTMGSSYFDVELYRNSFSYNSATGNFSTAGTDAGHTSWIFDASGNIIQTGDMILAVNFSPGLTPTIDLRIWVSQTTLSTVTPARFNFTGAFNGTTPAFGYATIVSKTGTTAWGAGISNFSGITAQDTTYATPWGTGSPAGVNLWSAQYSTEQLVEIGLNLSRIGVDPALYSALSPCQPLFSDIFFKSRSSNSFTSNMQDFVSPLTFTRNPVMDFSLQGDTIRCNHPEGAITLTNQSTVGVYTWKMLSGQIVGANGDSSQLDIDKPGTYIVSASPAAGCPPTRVDTVVVPIDTFPPIPSAFSGLSGNQIALYGGNPVASNYPTPFGGSDGLLYAWSGPDGFASTTQNPLTDTVWGTYTVTAVEKRNGCPATATTTIESNYFTALQANDLVLTGIYSGGAVALHWQDPNAAAVQTYTVQRLNADNNFQAIGVLPGGGNGGAQGFSYADQRPVAGNNSYRILATAHDGSVYYSSVVTASADASGLQNVALAGNYQSGMRLLVNTGSAARATLVIYDVAGETLQKREVYLGQGSNTIQLPSRQARAVQVVALFINDRVAFVQKALF